jgi:phosphoribosyl 1,2-cyclic phosphodiesterase
VSHSHGDHFGYIRQYLQAGIPVLTGSETFKAKDLEEFRYLFREALPGKGYKIGEFRILAFDLAHDVSCLGYHINHPESGNILFLTDTFYCPYTFENLNHIMIEANYADDVLERNILAGRVHPAFRPRLMYTHMELETTKGVLQSNDLSQVSNIILIHLSDGNSDQDRFKREIREATGKQVFIAEKGLQLDLNINPY